MAGGESPTPDVTDPPRVPLIMDTVLSTLQIFSHSVFIVTLGDRFSFSLYRGKKWRHRAVKSLV